MNRTLQGLVMAAAMAAASLAVAQPIKIFGLVELSGTGAVSGTNFNDGVKLAVKEINASGGILGRQVDYQASNTQQGNPYIFRTSFTQAAAMPKVARYLHDTVKAKSVAIIFVNNDFGKGGSDAMVKALEPYGIQVAANISTDPGQVDFSSAVVKAKQSNADALFVYSNEEESARCLRELKKQGYDKPI